MVILVTWKKLVPESTSLGDATATIHSHNYASGVLLELCR